MIIKVPGVRYFINVIVGCTAPLHLDLCNELHPIHNVCNCRHLITPVRFRDLDAG